MSNMMIKKLQADMGAMEDSELDQILANVDTSAKDKRGNSLLHFAVTKSVTKCRLVLKHAPHLIDQRNDNAETPLTWAIYIGRYQSAKVLIEAGADIDVKTHGTSLVHYASSGTNPVGLEFLRLVGGDSVDFEARDSDGVTPLMYAAKRDNYLHCKWLIENGCNPEATDMDGEIALHKACRHNATRAVWALLDVPGDRAVSQLNYVNREGRTPLKTAELATFTDYKELRKMLRRHQSSCWRFWDACTGGIYKIPTRRRTALHLKVVFLFMIIGSMLQNFIIFWPKDFYLSSVFVITVLIGLIIYVVVVNKDPGYVTTQKRKRKRERGDLEQFTAPLLGSDNESSIELFREFVRNGRADSVCISCQVVVPLRSKHCKELDVCIYRYDHFCPFLDAAVGRDNHVSFMFFLAWWIATMGLYFVLSYKSIIRIKDDWKRRTGGGGSDEATFYTEFVLTVIVGLTVFCMFAFALSLLLSHLWLVSKNLTTNEFINRDRYKYLQGNNPYHRGCCRNCCFYFCQCKHEELHFAPFTDITDPLDTSSRSQKPRTEDRVKESVESDQNEPSASKNSSGWRVDVRTRVDFRRCD